MEIRRPQQDRSRRSLEQILAAGIEMLARKGYDGFSIEAVSRRSGVSIGSIYQRFPSKAVLFAALQERILAQIDAGNDLLFAQIPAAALVDSAIVEAGVRAVADHVRRHEALLRVMILRGAVDEETRQRGSRSSMALASAYEGFLLRSVRRMGHEAPALAADMSFRIVYAALTRRVMSGATFESGTDIGWETFVAELARSQVSYLLAPREI